MNNSKFNTKEEFESIFRDYYNELCSFAFKYLKDPQDAEEIVQEMFVKLWEKKDNISISSSIRSYLYNSVKNNCLNKIKHIQIREKYKEHNEELIKNTDNSIDQQLEATELDEKITISIEMLPKARKKIFIMCRYDGLKYREIAKKLDISIKTVENQMGKALKFLRSELIDYITIIFILLNF